MDSTRYMFSFIILTFLLIFHGIRIWLKINSFYTTPKTANYVGKRNGYFD